MENFNLYNLPDDVLFKSNEIFYEFVEQVAGKTEADILRVQGIRNARCLIRSTNLLAILEIDCDEINLLKGDACFQCKNGEFVVKQGIQLNLDNLSDVLKDKHEKYKKKKQQRHDSASTNITNDDSLAVQNSSVGISMLDSSNNYSVIAYQDASISKYATITDHFVFIKDLIERFSRKTFNSIILQENKHYNLFITNDGQTFKATVKCQCGTKIALSIRSDTSTFILSNYYAHLTASNCPMVDRIFKEEKTSINELEDMSPSNSAPKSSISISNDNDSAPGKQAKRKQFDDILSTEISNSNKKKNKKK